MKQRKKKTLLILTLFLCLTLCVTALLAAISVPPAAPHQVKDINELEKYLQDVVAYGDPPGLSLTVVKDGKVVYESAFGLADGPEHVPATPDSIYHWWSTTKIFTAVAIFQLQEAELLHIDDTVDTYLPYFSVSYPSADSSPVTIRQLLNHSSGLPDNVPAVIGWMHLAAEPGLDQSALFQKALPDYAKLQFEPGAKSVYTNVGYMALGAVIEEVSSETYEAYVRNHILQPLNMEHTDFCYTRSMSGKAATGMHPLLSIQSVFLPFAYGNRLPGLVRQVEDGNIWFNHICADSNPPTGLIGPASDLGRFVTAYLNGGELGGRRILSAESIDEMMHDGYIHTGSSLQTKTGVQGLGWEICGLEEDLCLQHSGGGPGYGSAIRLLPGQSLGMVITANSTNLDYDSLFRLVEQLEW